MGAQVIHDTDYFNRTTHMFQMLKSAERGVNDFAMGFGVNLEANQLTIDNVKLSATTAIAAGKSMTVGCSQFILGLLNQSYCVPLRYAPIQIEFEIVNTASDAVKGNIAAVGAAADKSESLLIQNVQLKCGVVTIDNVMYNNYTDLLMRGQNLPIHFTSVAKSSQIIRDMKQMHMYHGAFQG